MPLNWFASNRFHGLRYEYPKQLWQGTGTIRPESNVVWFFPMSEVFEVLEGMKKAR